jgi:hypothetical protein
MFQIIYGTLMKQTSKQEDSQKLRFWQNEVQTVGV